MSNWHITITGSGPNQTGTPAVDVDTLTVSFVRQLEAAGHIISDAKIEDVAMIDKGSDVLAKAHT